MRLLDSLGILYTLKPHSRPVFTSEDAAAERGVRLSQIVKTMLVKVMDGTHVIALIPGDRKLDLKSLAKLTGGGKPQFAAREDVHRLTGYEPGAVSPIGMVKTYTTYFDATLLTEEYVDISSGRPDAGLELRSADLLSVLDARLADISQ